MSQIPPYKYHVSEAQPNEIKKGMWRFDWKEDFEEDRAVYKLMNQEKEIVGLISMEHIEDHVYIHAIERNQSYTDEKITPYLFAIASLWSSSFGYDSGFAFTAKSELIPYYERYGAKLINPKQRRMILFHDKAEQLVSQCLPNMNLSHSKL